MVAPCLANRRQDIRCDPFTQCFCFGLASLEYQGIHARLVADHHILRPARGTHSTGTLSVVIQRPETLSDFAMPSTVHKSRATKQGPPPRPMPLVGWRLAKDWRFG
jgi:hypothetical protein